MTVLNAAGVFCERYIHLPVKIILNAPVISQYLPVTLHRTPLATNEVAHFATGFPIYRPLSIALADDLELGPRLPISNPLRVGNDLIGAYLMTPMSILLGLIGLIVDPLAALLIDFQKTVLDVLLQMLLVAFDRQDIIAASLDNLLGNLLLTAHGIDGHQGPVQVQHLQELGNSRNLVGLFLGGDLTQDHPRFRCPGADQVQLTQGRRAAARMPQRFAVDGDVPHT